LLDMTEILPPLKKYKYNTWRILPVKCYIDNSVCLRSCIRNVNSSLRGYTVGTTTGFHAKIVEALAPNLTTKSRSSARSSI
jgi:hypothetical protein